MTYELTLHINDESPAGQNIETLVESEHISREEAALRLIASESPNRPNPASAAARRIIGAFKSPEDIAGMDEALRLAMEDRQRRNSAPAHE